MRENGACGRAPPWAPLGEDLQRSPDLLAGFGEGNRKGKMERTKDRKGTEEEGKEGSERGNGWNLGYLGRGMGKRSGKG